MPDGEIILNPQKMQRLKHAKFKVLGSKKHTAVKLCHWTKTSIKSGEENYCYKEKFYGIKSHRCLQMTPTVPFCNFGCQFCWRDITQRSAKWVGEYDEPESIVEQSIEAQRQLLSGLGGVKHSKQHLIESYTPKHVAISLDGEPTMYPKLAELILSFHRKNMTTFLVTNGTHPEKLEELAEKNALPTQLYVSVYGFTKEILYKVAHPIIKDAWERLNKTLEILPKLKTRKVCRLTLVKNINMIQPEKWGELLLIGQPDFVECKAAMAVGFAKSQGRIKGDDMPTHNDIKIFANDVAKTMGYEIVDEKSDSRVVLLSKSMEYYRRFPKLS